MQIRIDYFVLRYSRNFFNILVLVESFIFGSPVTNTLLLPNC